MNAILKFALEFGPLLIFFGVNLQFGIFAATGAFMAATFAALGVSYYKTRRIPPMPLITAVFVLVFGGLTLILADEAFIKLKPTLVYGLFAAILFGGLALKRPVLELVLGAALPPIDPAGWRALSFRWAFFFVALAALNEAVARSVGTDVWVAFKVFGVLPVSLIFAAAQAPLILRHQIKTETQTRISTN